MKKAIFIIIFAAVFSPAYSQETRCVYEYGEQSDTIKKHTQITDEQKATDALREHLDKQPGFGIYRDNYFITGIPTNRGIDKYTADAKFQISFRQILFKNILPRNNLLMLTYTQKSFWNIYQKSSPFSDNNYNPGITLSKPVMRKNQLKWLIDVGFEHESNGRDSILSRSRNYFVFSGMYYIDRLWSVQIKLWPGWTSDDNPDINNYRGWGLVAVNYRNRSERFVFSAVVTPCKNFRAVNTQIEASFKLWKSANQYLSFQWFQGYGENLMEYNRYTSMLRVGICIKPQGRNLF